MGTYYRTFIKKISDFFAQQQGYFLALGKTKSATILPM